MKTTNKMLGSLPLTAAMLILTAGAALAQTTRNYTGASKSNGDSWNTATNWSGTAVPSGTDNVTIPNTIYVTADTTTPAYTGNLSLGTGATLQCGYGAPNGSTFMNALGSAASTVITMGDGATILLRGNYSPAIPAIVLNGNVSLILGASTSASPTPTSSKGITGAYGLTLKGKSGASITFNTTANTFSSLSTGHEYGSGFTINANVAGALGTGDVTIRAAPAGTIGANLVLGAADAISSTATLSLYGPASTTKLKVTAANSVKRLVVDGVPQVPGVYGKTGSGAQYPVSWIDATSTNTLTVTGAPSQYWDLDDSTPGAGSTAGDASGTWNAGNAFWNNAAGDGTAAAWTAGQQAVFAAGTDALAVSAVAVEDTQDIGGLSFEEGTFTLSGGTALRMTSDSEVNVGTGLSATISTPISNDSARQLIKVGAGTLTLSGTNTYTGTTRVEQGILSVASLAAAGSDSPIGNFPTAGAGGLLLGGGTFQYTGGNATVNRGFSVAGSGGIDIQADSTSLTMGDVESINQPSTLTVTGGTGSSLTIGRARIVEAAQLTLNPTTASMTVGTVNGYTSYASSSIITLGGTATGNVVTGAISVTNPPGSGFTQTLALVKSGSGDWKLNGSSNYSGNTTVNTGNLIAGTNALNNAAGAFGQQNNVDIALGVANGNNNAGILIGGAFTIGRTIRFATQNATDMGSRVLTLGGNTADNSVFSAAIYLGTASQTSKGVTLTAANGGQVTFSGVIQNPTGQDATEAAAAAALTAVTKVGPGTVALTNANTYTGNTLVSEGTLSLGNGTANSNLYDLSTVSVATGAVLNLNYTGSDAVFFLNIDGSAVGAGLYGNTASGADNGGAGVGVYDTYFTGTGVINNTNGILLPGLYVWDGGVADIPGNGNGLSAGGTGTWNTALKNWDRGITPYAVWGNTATDSAIFGGAAGTVTLAEDITLNKMTLSTVGYTFGGSSLNFAASSTIEVTTDADGTMTFNNGVTGSPAVRIPGANAGNIVRFNPTSVSQALGVITNPYYDGTGDKGMVYLDGSTTGNTVAGFTYQKGAPASQHYGYMEKRGTGTWTINGDVEQGRVVPVAGTLIINGTFTSLYQGLQPIPSTARVGGALNYYQSDSRFGHFTVNSGGIVAPGNPAVANGVGTIIVEFNTVRSEIGYTTFNNGSIYEWQVGPANVTDKVHVKRTSTATNNNRTLTVGAMVLKILDAGGAPADGTVQLPVFTYDAGVVRTLSLGSVVFDTSDLVGKGWTIGTLALTDNGTGTIYLTGLSKGGSPYATWATGSEPFDGDANGDGVDDGLAWFLGAANPAANALDKLPTVGTPTGFLTLDFDRVNPYAPAKLYVEYGSDLAGWTKLEIPATSGTIGGDIEVVVTPGTPDQVLVKIPTSHASGGKLFARLTAENP